jgi:glutathione-regulated potassium-efflux system ancillary protein KefC/glutathione-regulated potassium-efflux system protein KefB
VAQTKVSEAFPAAALLVVLGTALLVNAVGLSMALGAFIAGLLLADSEFRHELEADIEPFKGLLLGLFFMSVGIAANVGLLLEHPGRVALLVAGLVTVKFVLLYVLARLTRHSADSARGMAFALPQAGEFGFVLFSLAVAHRVMDPSLAEMLVIVVTISMIVSPLLLSLHTNVIEPRLAKAGQREFDRVESHDSRVIIAGFGRVGQIVGRILRMRRIAFTALESSVAQVDFVRRFGNQIYYGDASRLDLLRAAGAAAAEVFVLAIDEVDASLRTAELVRTQFPHLKILARARTRQHAFALMDLGVGYIMRETFLSSLDMAAITLQTLGEDAAIARATVRRFRQHDEATLASQYAIKEDEAKLIAASRESAQQLEKLFEADAARPAPVDPRYSSGHG